MNNSALPYGLDRRSRRGAMGKGGRKILPAKTPRNPLKRLDSDERIQGNPRKSNSSNRGFRSETAGAKTIQMNGRFCCHRLYFHRATP
jgi:hypothetical protein